MTVDAKQHRAAWHQRGWCEGRVMAVALGVFGCLVAAQVEAATPVQPAAPDEAFLLFLAEATEIEGQWVDPLTLAEVEDDLTGGTGEAGGTAVADETGMEDDTVKADMTGKADITDLTGKASVDSGFAESHPGESAGPDSGTHGGHSGFMNGSEGHDPADSGVGEGER